MLIAYVRALLYIWLLRNDQASKPLVDETLKFYWWLLELRRAAFLPGTNKQSIIYRNKEILKTIRKIPPLSKEFYNSVDNIDSLLPTRIQPLDRQFILSKKSKLATVRSWLITSDSSQISILKESILLENPHDAKMKFQRKRNHRSSK